MLQDVVEWNVSDSAIDNNFTMSLTGFENKEVLVRTRLLGQREKLQEPAWTEIILGNEQQSSAKILSQSSKEEILPKHFLLNKTIPTPSIRLQQYAMQFLKILMYRLKYLTFSGKK